MRKEEERLRKGDREIAWERKRETERNGKGRMGEIGQKSSEQTERLRKKDREIEKKERLREKTERLREKRKRVGGKRDRGEEQ